MAAERIIVQQSTFRDGAPAGKSAATRGYNLQEASAPMASYSPVARGFHWLTAILVLAAFVLSVGGPETRVFSEANQGALVLHESLGVTVFALTALRMGYRFWSRPPAAPPMPNWMHLAAAATSAALYFLLAFIPLSAIAGSWLEGHPLSFYLIGEIGSPWASSQALGQSMLSLHKLAGDAIMWLAGLHAAAALYHHFILRDAVLRSMLGSR
jgi:cytochrome b561